jgi:hypothetical protein
LEICFAARASSLCAWSIGRGFPADRVMSRADAEQLSDAEQAEITECIARNDLDSLCDLIGRCTGRLDLAAYFRGKKPAKLGAKDPEKYTRDVEKAEFKGLVDYLVEEEGMRRDAAFNEALEIKAMVDENVAWDVAIGKRGDITRLSKTIHNPYVEQRRLSHALKLGMPSPK